MGTDCQAPYTDGISIDSSAPWKISAVTNYNVGWNDPVCIVCENKIDKVPLLMTIDQLPCSVSNNCPPDDHSDDPAPADPKAPAPVDPCTGKLTAAKDQKKIDFKFVADKTP